MNLEYKVTTSLTDDGKAIASEISTTGIDGAWKSMGYRIAQLEDQGVRAALVKAGWLPPSPDVPNALNAQADRERLRAIGDACFEAIVNPASRVETGYALLKMLAERGFEVRPKS